jgi:hypothetical protein
MTEVMASSEVPLRQRARPALALPPTHQQRRRLWQAYHRARHQQRQVYQAVQRRWAQLYAAYHQLLLGGQAVQEAEARR